MTEENTDKETNEIFNALDWKQKAQFTWTIALESASQYSLALEKKMKEKGKLKPKHMKKMAKATRMVAEAAEKLKD